MVDGMYLGVFFMLNLAANAHGNVTVFLTYCLLHLDEAVTEWAQSWLDSHICRLITISCQNGRVHGVGLYEGLSWLW